MIYKLTGEEIMVIIAKHAAKEHPELHKLDGKQGNIALVSDRSTFWAEITVPEESDATL